MAHEAGTPAPARWEHADRQRAAEHAVSRVLAEAEGLEDAAPRILAALRDGLGAELAELWLPGADGAALARAWVATPPQARRTPFSEVSETTRFTPGVGLPGRVWESGRPAWISDLEIDPNFPRASAALESGLRSGFAFPIAGGREFFGVVELFFAEPREADSPLLETMAAIGNMMAQFLRRRRAELAIQESEARTRAMLETALDCIISLDAEGHVREFNPAAERVFGWTREQAVGRLAADLFIPESLRDAHREGLERFVATGEARILDKRLELPARHSDGHEFPCELTVTAARGADGRPFFTGYLRDITERKRAEAALRDRTEQLAEADRRKNDFLALLAHELRNPLAPIQNAVELLRLDPAGKAAGIERATELIARQTAQLRRLVDDLLDVARITHGRIQLRREPVEVTALLERAEEAAAPTLAAKRQRLSVERPPSPLWIDADATRIVQVIANLLDNASKYSQADTQITLSALRSGNEVEICVRDEGDGIPPDALETIFEAFLQRDVDLARSRGGLGLGLSIVKGLVESHGGSVAAHSEGEGLGSEFQVRLPLASASEPPSRSEPPARKPAPQSARVLVVEDLPDARDSLVALLGQRGFEVEGVPDGPGAIALAERFQPDVILLDLGLPGMDGFEVARRLRAGPAPRARLVALTGYGDAAARERSREAGFDEHLLKPVTFETLAPLLVSGR